MSGIEVAGIILAVIPLFISAAEHYRAGLDTGKRCWNKDRILLQYREELEFQRTYLILNLKAMLVDVDLEIVEKEALIGVTDTDIESSRPVPALNDVWEQPHVKKKLISRLGEAHDSFVSLLQSSSQALLLQVEKHEACRDTQNIKACSPAECANRLRAFHDKLKSAAGFLDGRVLWECVKFSWQEPERNKMILDLRGNNDKLHILLRMLQAAQPFYTEQRSRRAKDVFGVREEIRRVHQVLSQYCHCTCTPAHEAKLSLRRGYCERKLLDQACFDTILYQTPLIPHHTTIRFAHSASSASGRKVRISIQKDDGDHSGHDGQREALADLCRAMSTCQANLARLNLIIDDESKLWAVQVPQTSPPAESAHFYTLETLLGASSRYKKEPKWLAKEKCIFAVILCHSLLHLDGTQWLKDGWHAENIKCVQDEQLCLAKATRFQLNHPYISADIMAADASLTTAAQSLTVDKSHGHPIPGLLTLGIILLELYLNGPLESAEDVERLANVHLWAISVLESCREDKDMDASYYNAIQFCLWPPAGRCTFENTKFRDDYYQKVVVPLEEALTEGFDFSENEMAGL